MKNVSAREFRYLVLAPSYLKFNVLWNGHEILMVSTLTSMFSTQWLGYNETDCINSMDYWSKFDRKIYKYDLFCLWIFGRTAFWLSISYCYPSCKVLVQNENLFITMFQRTSIIVFIKTRPNEFGSMSTRKDITRPIKSIFCRKRPLKGYKRPSNCYKRTMKRPYKAMLGRTRP